MKYSEASHAHKSLNTLQNKYMDTKQRNKTKLNMKKFMRMYLFHVVDQSSHLKLQVSEGELHLLSLLNLKLLLLLCPPQFISGGIVHHSGVAAIFLLLFQLKSKPFFKFP